MADCIGPHQRGKKGSSCRTGGLWAPDSARFRPGTGDRDRSDSAMGASMMPCWSLMIQIDCNHEGSINSQTNDTISWKHYQVTAKEIFQQEIPLEERQDTKNKRREGKEETLQERKGKKTTNQIGATVHFWPKRSSRKFLERKFGILFRPNIANNTRSRLCSIKCSTSTSIWVAFLIGSII